MKKKGLIIIAILAVVLIGMNVFVAMKEKPVKMSESDLTIVTAPDQQEAMTHEKFTVAEYVQKEVKGTNVATEGRAVSNGNTDVYVPAFAIDGSRDGGSYWEGPEGVSELEVDLKNTYNLHTAVIGLNPNQIWSERTQTLSVSVSEDGKNYTEVAPETSYTFDPNFGNEAIIEFGQEIKARYVKVVITSNTGAKGGQIAELEIYTNDK